MYVCVPPPPNHKLKPDPQSDGIWRWNFWEVSRFRWANDDEAPWWDNFPHMKKKPVFSFSAFLSLPLENTMSKEEAKKRGFLRTCKPRREIALEPDHVGSKPLGFPVSRTVRKAFLFLSHLHAQSLSCVPLCNPVDDSPPSSSFHDIDLSRILVMVVISYSRGYWTHISCIFCIGRRILYHWATWEAQQK